MKRFEDKRVIVTGGSKGLGRTIVDRFAAEGAEVLIVGRNEADLERVAGEVAEAGGKVWSLPGDIAEPQFCNQVIEAAIERWDRIDVLVNNAGVADKAEILEIELEQWNYVFDVMVQAPFVLSQGAARKMVSDGGGAIVSLSSIDGYGVDGPFASYSVAKAAVMQLTKNLAVELASRGVRANTVSPGWVRTPMVEEATEPEELEEMMTNFNRVPMRRMVLPEEVASAVCYLASEEASAITGTDLVVDGGTLADLYILPTLVEDEED